MFVHIVALIQQDAANTNNSIRNNNGAKTTLTN